LLDADDDFQGVPPSMANSDLIPFVNFHEPLYYTKPTER
jgi:hypothetical protein